ncbi:MAG: 50S ribosomal protein L29 [Spirochaetota bacterium]|nr:MAG: 50S ribosomal protein L29 [Spirochaetota bacterium]
MGKENLNEMTIDELKELKDKCIKDYRIFRFNKIVGQLENELKIRETRRSIARINTILREYELGIRKSKVESKNS